MSDRALCAEVIVVQNFLEYTRGLLKHAPLDYLFFLLFSKPNS